MLLWNADAQFSLVETSSVKIESNIKYFPSFSKQVFQRKLPISAFLIEVYTPSEVVTSSSLNAPRGTVYYKAVF